MLHFVIALEAEARPLIEHYGLKRDPSARAFKVFRGDDVSVVISGIGKVAAAAATVFLHTFRQAPSDRRSAAVWLNVGIAGHSSRAVGEAMLAHKIRDAASGRAWYPPQVVAAPCPSDPLTTVDQPERTYGQPGAYDMEASGFYPTACRFASSELVHCLKIVSDGPDASLERLTMEQVPGLVAGGLEVIAAWAEACLPLAAELAELEADPPDLDTCRERFRFTVAERSELHRQLVRRRALAPELPLPLDDLADDERGKVVNRRLRLWLDSLAVAGD